MPKYTELTACAAVEPKLANFNTRADIPYGCTPTHVHAAMVEFTSFLTFINTQLNSRGLVRLESMLMAANFSSMVSEFAGSTIPKHCRTLVKNRHHNGHPDLVEAGMHLNDAVQHHGRGIEVKASRYLKGWQGHNKERTWLMVFMFESSRPDDVAKAIDPIPFRFMSVVGAQLEECDWNFSGRSETSRRTITASVTQSGYEKMTRNWIYRAPT